MQKIMACIAQPGNITKSDWSIKITECIAKLDNSFPACSYTVADDAVSAADLLVMDNTEHPKDAVISFWVEDAYNLEPIYEQLSLLGDFQSYAVMESSPLLRTKDSGRVEGMCQVALLKKPQAMARQDWLDIWLGDHTKIAIDTQSTFGYRQNVVVTALPIPLNSEPEWPLMDAIVEENFPSIAMTDREAFFDSQGNAEQFEERQQAMMQSCFRFIDFETFDCIPMSEHIVETQTVQSVDS